MEKNENKTVKKSIKIAKFVRKELSSKENKIIFFKIIELLNEYSD